MHGTHKHYLQINQNQNLNRNPEAMQNLGPGKFSRNRNKNARYHPNVKKRLYFCFKGRQESGEAGGLEHRSLHTGHMVCGALFTHLAKAAAQKNPQKDVNATNGDRCHDFKSI